MRKFLGILILISFFMTAFPRFSSAQYSQQQVAPQTSSHSQTLGWTDDLKTGFLTMKGFLAGDNNIFMWVIGRAIGPDGQEVLQENGLIGAILYGILVQLLGLPSEIFANASPPPEAIVMPPGDWYFSGGAIGTTSKLTASVLTTPPVSGVYYAQSLLEDVGVKTTYAQGAFFDNSFTVILNLWKVIRNIVFALLAVAFVIFGLMIMFRFKISPQAVMTVEAALPRLIAVMLFITFSYAIAGFLYDLMYLIIGVVINIFQSEGIGGKYLFDKDNPRALSDMLHWGLDGEIAQVFTSYTGLAFTGAAVTGVIALVIGVILSSAGAAAVPFLIFALFLVSIILYVLIKTFIELIKTYVSIVLLIIFSPIYIFAGVFPGSPLGFGSWIKNLFANLMVFPAVTLLLILAAEFTKIGQNLDPISLPHIGSGFGTAGVVLAFGAILYLPSVPALVKNALGASGTGGVGSAFGPVFGFVNKAATPIIQTGVTSSDAEYAQTSDGGNLEGQPAEEGTRRRQVFAKTLKVLGRAR